MGLDANTIRKWAAGATTKSRDSDEDEDAPEGLDPEKADADPDADAEQNRLWAGELAPDEEVDPEAAEELVAWLRENEPEIADAALELAGALASEEPDPRMIQHARQELQGAQQYLAPEYPELTPEQRGALESKITDELKVLGFPMPESPEFNVAVALGIARARAGDPEDLAIDDGEDDEIGPGAPPAKPKPKPTFGAKKPAFPPKKGPPGLPAKKGPPGFPPKKGPPAFGGKKPNPFAKKGPPMAAKRF